MVEGCFNDDSSYSPIDLPGHGKSVEPDPNACQLRCTNVEGCSYFSFWPNEKSCHLSGPNVKKIPDKWGAVSGPKKCDECKLTCYSKPILQYHFYVRLNMLKKSHTNSLTTIVRGDTCNCDGKPGHSNWIFEHKSDFPDYESCRKKCIGTEGCHYFGIWTSINKGYCRLWKKCETCNEALYPNKVYQLSRGIKLILL